MRLPIIIAAILAVALFLGGCWHVAKTPPPTTPPTTTGTTQLTTTTTSIDTSDWQTYTNKDYGFSFRYPGEWGTVVESAEKESPFDTGVRNLVTFSKNQDVIINSFSDDYSVGVGEGSPLSFDPKINFDDGTSSLKKTFSSDKKYGIFRIVDLRKIFISDQKNTLRLVEERGYADSRASITYLLKNFNKRATPHFVITAIFGRVIPSINEQDAINKEQILQEIQDNSSEVEKFEEFIKTLKKR